MAPVEPLSATGSDGKEKLSLVSISPFAREVSGDSPPGVRLSHEEYSRHQCPRSHRLSGIHDRKRHSA